MKLIDPVVALPTAQSEKFIRKFGLWSDDQHMQAAALKERVLKEDIRLFRVAWADPQGVSRAKTVTQAAFLGDEGFLASALRCSLTKTHGIFGRT